MGIVSNASHVSSSGGVARHEWSHRDNESARNAKYSPCDSYIEHSNYASAIEILAIVCIDRDERESDVSDETPLVETGVLAWGVVLGVCTGVEYSSFDERFA
jgi:hypothetical protein